MLLNGLTKGLVASASVVICSCTMCKTYCGCKPSFRLFTQGHFAASYMHGGKLEHVEAAGLTYERWVSDDYCIAFGTRSQSSNG